MEISQIYPQFSLKSINRLEALFCREIKWNLYISSSLYAKYYFALRSLYEKKDFRRYVQSSSMEMSFNPFIHSNYNAMMLTDAPGAQHVKDRSDEIRRMMITLSRSF